MGFVKMMFKTSCIASHLHYNNIFMHYRCVLYLLQCCVLIGLDWTEPTFFFCMSYVHAFSCICTFNFIYFDIFVAWYVSDYLPLFLFFSPSYICCVMAPKRKSTPSQNHFRSGASSSSAPSDPTPSHVWFRVEKAKSDFFENFSRRDINLEC